MLPRLTYPLTTSHHRRFSPTISMLQILSLSFMVSSPLTGCQTSYLSLNLRSSKNCCQVFKRRDTVKRPILQLLPPQVLIHQRKGQQPLALTHKPHLMPLIATHMFPILHFLATHWRLDEGIWTLSQRTPLPLLPFSHLGQETECLSVLSTPCLG
jgi:hypothetical protein